MSTKQPTAMIPPHSKDTELEVLSAMMLAPSAIDEVVSILPEPGAFYSERHQMIYRALVAIRDRHDTPDIITLTAELRRRGQLADIGGPAYLSEVSSRAATAARIGAHARIVAEHALKRQMILAARQILAAASDDGTDAFAVVDEAMASVTAIAERRAGGQSYRSMQAVLVAAVEHIERASHAHREGRTLGIPTGLVTIDGALGGGFQRTDLITLGARPGMGKTSFLLTAASGAARAGYSAGIVSLEMSAEQLAMRGIAEESRLSTQLLRSGELKDEDWQTINDILGRLSGLTIWFDDQPAQAIGQIAARARVLQRRHGLDILFVDYLQLSEAGGDAGQRRTRDQDIGIITRGLKALAKELRVPVVALSQLNRALESRADKTPQLSDLRESGSVEADSDVVMFIHRPEYYGITIDDKGQPTEGIAKIIFAKHRNGESGIHKDLHFAASTCSFHDLALRPNAPEYTVTPRRASESEEAPF